VTAFLSEFDSHMYLLLVSESMRICAPMKRPAASQHGISSPAKRDKYRLPSLAIFQPATFRSSERAKRSRIVLFTSCKAFPSGYDLYWLRSLIPLASRSALWRSDRLVMSHNAFKTLLVVSGQDLRLLFLLGWVVPLEIFRGMYSVFWLVKCIQLLPVLLSIALGTR